MRYKIYIIALPILFCACGSDTDKSIDNLIVDTVGPAMIDTAKPYMVSDAPTKPNIESMSVLNEEGDAVELDVADNNLCMIMATWCHYSKATLEILNDERYHSFFKKYKIVLLFDENEIDKLISDAKANPKEYGAETQEQLDLLIKNLEARKAYSKVFSSEFLSDIPPGIQYYYIGRNFHYERGGFPSAYNADTKSFTVNPFSWLHKRELSQRSRDLIKQMLKRYNKG